jgi:hypothetical protein
VDEVAIQKAFRDYNDAFARNPTEAVGFWLLPALIVLPEEVISLNARGDLENLFAVWLADLERARYSHSEFVTPRVKMLNATTALYGVIANRMRVDGSVSARLGLTYLFRKFGGE